MTDTEVGGQYSVSGQGETGRVGVELAACNVFRQPAVTGSGETLLANQFALKPSQGQFPSGSYRLLVHSKPHTVLSHELPHRLFIDYGSGYARQHSLLLPPLSTGVSDYIFFLTRPAKSLYLHLQGAILSVHDTAVELERLRSLPPPAATARRLWQIFRSNPDELWRRLSRRAIRPLNAAIPPHVLAVALKAWRKIFRSSASKGYRHWLRRHHSISRTNRRKLLQDVSHFEWLPTISILMPTYNTPVRLLTEAIESVRSQIYPKWQLCIADDASSNPEVRFLLERYQRLDGRIRVRLRGRNEHISKATNTALELADGEYLALLDHDDRLSEDALFQVVKALQGSPRPLLIYSDEDKIDERGLRFEPFFKPSFSPDLLLCQNYISHLGVYEANLFKELGGMRAGYEGAQDYDLLLRFTERVDPERITHIPRVLYHWRVTRGSTARGSREKPYAATAARRAIDEHLKRTGCQATVVDPERHPHYHRVKWPLFGSPPRVSIIIPTRDRVDLLRTCLDSIYRRTSYANFEVVVVDNASIEPETVLYFEGLRREKKAIVVAHPGEFNYSALNNHGVSCSNGEIIILLNNDIEVLSPEWLDELVGQLQRPEVGVVGPRLLFPDGTIQHGGVTLGVGGVASHAFYGGSPFGSSHFAHESLVRNVSAVTGACLATRRNLYLQVGGLDEDSFAVGYNDTDYCLKVLAAGFRVLYDPFVDLIHHESRSRGEDLDGPKLRRFLGEQARLQAKWLKIIASDPFYNPNLSLSSNQFELAHPPRTLSARSGMRLVSTGPDEGL